MLSDKELKQNILLELEFDSGVNAARIGVVVEDGAVTLTGTVGDYNQRFAAINAVTQMAGVKALADDINIVLPHKYLRDDTEIAKHISHVFQNNVSIPEGSVKALVHHGMVTLNGQVKSENQRKIIKQQIAHIAGVKNINNRVTLESSILTKEVKEKIDTALKRNAKLESDNVNVEVVDDKVILSGHVKSLYERELVQSAAWRADGVTKVVDNIVVDI